MRIKEAMAAAEIIATLHEEIVRLRKSIEASEAGWREVRDVLEIGPTESVLKAIDKLMTKEDASWCTGPEHAKTERKFIEVSWSDRVTRVYPDDPDSMADAVMNCALDHCYDTTVVPHEMPRRIELFPVVTKHLDAASKDWRTKTIAMTEEQRMALRADVLKVLRGA